MVHSIADSSITVWFGIVENHHSMVTGTTHVSKLFAANLVQVSTHSPVFRILLASFGGRPSINSFYVISLIVCANNFSSIKVLMLYNIHRFSLFLGTSFIISVCPYY